MHRKLLIGLTTALTAAAIAAPAGAQSVATAAQGS
jgi:hypothetical protein